MCSKSLLNLQMAIQELKNPEQLNNPRSQMRMYQCAISWIEKNKLLNYFSGIKFTIWKYLIKILLFKERRPTKDIIKDQ